MVFACAALPMLLKAIRSRDLTSYSTGNLVLANVGNAVYSIYVFHLPPGPVWALHTFYVVSSALMLFWSRRYAPGRVHGRTHPSTRSDNGSITRRDTAAGVHSVRSLPETWRSSCPSNTSRHSSSEPAKPASPPHAT